MTTPTDPIAAAFEKWLATPSIGKHLARNSFTAGYRSRDAEVAELRARIILPAPAI